MSNVLSSNPLIIDTSTAVSIDTRKFKIWGIWWASQTAADTCVIKDNDGVVKWQATGLVSPFVTASDEGITFNGLQVTTLSAGTLFLYHRVLR